MKAHPEIMLTVNDLECMPEDGNRYEVIDGDLYVSTSPSYHHQFCLLELVHALKLHLTSNPVGEVMFGLGVIFDDFNGVIPDVIYFSNERKKVIVGQRLTAAPEIVVEALSPGQKNEYRDRKVKRRLYSENGVLEYWILDHETRTVEVHRAAKTGGFKMKTVLRGNAELTTPLLPGFRVEVDKLFAKD
ncbi:MAG TPA: Uma2 family endonuclease [Bryobacteraceae bacterium]|nr:Uma2 family endonuclease [Bryobacteraceae bacterium]